MLKVNTPGLRDHLYLLVGLLWAFPNLLPRRGSQALFPSPTQARTSSQEPPLAFVGQNPRLPDWLSLEGTSGGHLVLPPAPAGTPEQGAHETITTKDLTPAQSVGSARSQRPLTEQIPGVYQCNRLVMGQGMG